MKFGDRLKYLRETNNLDRENMAKIFNISYSAISKYETNVRFPDQETLKKIADYFDVSIDYLLGRTDIKKNSNDTPIKKPTLSDKDEKDIAKHLEKTMELLEQQDSIMFDGEALDDETKELLRQSLENSMRMAKVINKKYTPKKHKK